MFEANLGLYNIDPSETIGISIPRYMSPELLEYREDFTNKVDIWALGWTFFEVLYKSDPFPIDNVRAHIFKSFILG